MSKMFVANLSKQVHDFVYRLPENPSAIRLTLQPLSQLPIPGAGGSYDLSTPEIEAIVNHHARYGLRHVSEVTKERGQLSPLAYSLDKPINLAAIRTAMEHNHGVLDATGREIRKQAAVAVNEQIEQSLDLNNPQAHLKGFEMTVVEDEPKRGADDGHKPINEGVRVTRQNEGPPPRQSRRRAA